MHVDSTKLRIFITGSTGYIGGSVLTRLINHPKIENSRIRALVRSAEKAAKLATFGVEAVVGSYSDLDLLTTLSSEADAVFACADADDLNAANAILKGLQLRFTRTGVAAILIHTSGTGVLIDDAMGMHPTDRIYSDFDITQLDTLALTQPHRDVDVAIADAGQKEYVKTYLILPSTIYGIASGPLVEQSIQNPYSKQMPALIRSSLARGQGGMVGIGANIWPNVHIDDVADLYIVLLDAILSDNPPSILEHGHFGYYFAENGEYKMYDACKKIAEVLYECGRGTSPDPTTYSDEEARKFFSPNSLKMMGANSRCEGKRSRLIGWKPVMCTVDMLKGIEPEVEAWIRKETS